MEDDADQDMKRWVKALIKPAPAYINNYQSPIIKNYQPADPARSSLIIDVVLWPASYILAHPPPCLVMSTAAIFSHHN